jgi:hypothetical protein
MIPSDAFSATGAAARSPSDAVLVGESDQIGHHPHGVEDPVHVEWD